MFDVRDYAWLHASKVTEKADKRAVLEWFVERVRAGKKVNPAVMEFIAAGVEQHLAGKKPWAARRGIKKKGALQAMQDAFPIYAEFQRIMTESFQPGEPVIRGDKPAHVLPVSPAEAITFTSEKFNVSEDTVKRAIATVQEGRKTFQGRPLYDALSQYQVFLEYLKSPDGKAWLESPDGKAWQKDANI